MSKVPQHIAIIMDGNGRWANKRGLSRLEGHKAGMQALCRIVRYAADIKLPWLTLFAFSQENWGRPQQEVAHLLELLKLFVQSNLLDLCEKGICIRIIGEKGKMPPEIAKILEHVELLTANNKGLNLIVAFNYSGQDEILRAARRIGEDFRQGKIAPEHLTKELFSEYLDTKGVPDPDLIIRTSGERRLSNFLLWQSAYAELYFCPSYWPDFCEKDLQLAIADYHSRERRFGGLKEQ